MIQDPLIRKISGQSAYQNNYPEITKKLIKATIYDGEPIIPFSDLLVSINTLYNEIFNEGLINSRTDLLNNLLDDRERFENYLINKDSIDILLTLDHYTDQRDKALIHFEEMDESKAETIEISQEDCDQLDDIMDAISKYTLDHLKMSYSHRFDINKEPKNPIKITIMGGCIAGIDGGEPNQLIQIYDLD